MIIEMGMPYCRVTFTNKDTRMGIRKLIKSLTVPVKRFVTGSKTEITDICLLETEGVVTRFRTGLLARIQMLAPMMGLDIENVVLHKKKDVVRIPELAAAADRVKLRDYQEEAVRQILQHDMGVLYAATGAGKTHMAAAIIAHRAIRTLFLVHTKDLLWQTKDRFEKVLGIKVGVVGDGEFEIGNVIVATIQTLHKAPPQALQFEVDQIIQDETHHIPADTFYSVTARFDADYVHGLSATPYRSDGADMMIEAAAGPIRSKVTVSDLIVKGYLAKPVIRFIPIQEKTSYSAAMRYMVIRKHLVEHAVRNQVIADTARQFASEGKSVLVAVNQVKHAEILRSVFSRTDTPVVILDGSVHSMARKKMLKDLQEKKTKIIISTLMKEGVDVPSLDVVINAAGGSDIMQLIGRALRISDGKDVATIVDFIDNQHIRLLQNSRSRMKRCKQEEAFLVVAA